ncbi:MAG: DUF2889 domain-containing protein [Magnetovibrio sp.]|nr:DUF2889 domain-containing protein [Magnetovibrio sp.]
MALSRPAARKHIHTRRIECHGYERDDGLWDIEAVLVDQKTYPFDNVDRGVVSAGEPVHRMVVRITVDLDLVVHGAEAVTEASPYTICADANLTVPDLVGVRIGPGWRKEVKRVMGRTKGCTHVRDLFMGPLAQAAYQTIIPVRSRRRTEAPDPAERPPVLGTCHAYATDGPVVERQWPQFYEAEQK